MFKNNRYIFLLRIPKPIPGINKDNGHTVPCND